jgi:hypothetical protein
MKFSLDAGTTQSVLGVKGGKVPELGMDLPVVGIHKIKI